MKRSAGLWIDHTQAFLVFVGDGAEEAQHVKSGMEAHVRFSGGNRREDGSADDKQDRQFATHLNRYYDEVIAQLGDAAAILIFGPGEAKGELKSRLAHKGLEGRIVGVEVADKMTPPQIAAKVREHFQI
jgi:hypothetical protein